MRSDDVRSNAPATCAALQDEYHLQHKIKPS